MQKKGQVGLADAPHIVLIVGLVFLLMATLGYIGLKFGDATATETTTTVSNETIALSEKYVYLANYNKRNAVCSFTQCVNATNGVVIPLANFSTSSTNCNISDTGLNNGHNGTNIKCTYSYTWDLNSMASNVTDAMETEISNNTSIAGIVLTISLIGIVLGVLVGVFVLARRKGL